MKTRAAVAWAAGQPLSIETIDIRGTAFGGARGRTDVPRIVGWYMQGKINIDDLITHPLPLEDINRDSALMEKGESIRSVVLY
jgi:S-(hydroxymethyl)glutathione dehydrogenase/alcohol dehydrogenase